MTHTIAPAPWRVESVTVRRWVREGSCPVLLACVEYPVLSSDSEDGHIQAAVRRFNEMYRPAAEAFVAWALDQPAADALEAFRAAGVGAVYRFARRELLCRITAELAERPEGGAGQTGDAPTRLCVTVHACRRVRRASADETILERVDTWLLPEGILLKPSARHGYSTMNKKQKTYRKHLKK